MNLYCWQSIDLVFPVSSRKNSWTEVKRKKPTKNLSSQGGETKWRVSLIGPTRAPNRNRNSAGVFAVFARMILTARKKCRFWGFFSGRGREASVGWTTFEYDCYFVDEFPLVWFGCTGLSCKYLLFIFAISSNIFRWEENIPLSLSPSPAASTCQRLISCFLVIIEQPLHLVLILIPIRISNNSADKMVDAPESPQPQQQSV